MNTRIVPFLWFAFFGAISFADEPTTLSIGTTQFTHAVGDNSIDVFTYRAENFSPKRGPIVLIFHGINRNADEYLEWAKPIANALEGVVAAPRFTKEAFPTSAFQQGNLFSSGKLQPRAKWTWSTVPTLVDAVRQRAGRADALFYLIGHSAGGQFLCRLAGFTDMGAARIVAANPGTHLFPTRDMNYPLGFGGLPNEISDDAALRKYLAQPLTLFLGMEDVVADKNFDVSPTAMKQGANRYERGKNAFEFGRKLAATNGWLFHWKLVEAPEVGHNAEKMFAHPNCEKALLGKFE